MQYSLFFSTTSITSQYLQDYLLFQNQKDTPLYLSYQGQDSIKLGSISGFATNLICDVCEAFHGVGYHEN